MIIIIITWYNFLCRTVFYISTTSVARYFTEIYISRGNETCTARVSVSRRTSRPVTVNVAWESRFECTTQWLVCKIGNTFLNGTFPRPLTINVQNCWESYKLSKFKTLINWYNHNFKPISVKNSLWTQKIGKQITPIELFSTKFISGVWYQSLAPDYQLYA